MDDPTSRLSDNRPASRQIAAAIRDDIVSGKLTPGTRLPSTARLAIDWNASSFTVYTALHTLVKEGLIERQRGSGSYVTDPNIRFTCAAIYHAGDIFMEEQRAFGRCVHASLTKSLARMKIDSSVFIDSRPYAKQTAILPALSEAILYRRVQCVIAPTVNPIALPAWSRLALPTAFASNHPRCNRAQYDIDGFFDEAIRHLASQGCQTIGMISNVTDDLGHAAASKAFHDLFLKAVRQQGLITREEWIRKPRRYTPDLEGFGYQEFGRLWRLREKPQGLIIHPDVVVRGAILAILELGMREVTSRMKFVFHRNAHIPFICPFAVTWALTDEDRLAEELIRAVLRQFKGEKSPPALIPYTFYRDKG